MKKLLLVFAATVIFLFLGAYIARRNVRPGSGEEIAIPTVTTGTPIPTPIETVTPSPTGPTPTQKVANIVVEKPFEGDTVGTTFMVSGRARVFENVVSIRVLDSTGKKIVETFTEAQSPDIGQFGPFQKSISLPPNTNQGKIVLEVYQASARDGSDADKVTVNLNYQK